MYIYIRTSKALKSCAPAQQTNMEYGYRVSARTFRRICEVTSWLLPCVRILQNPKTLAHAYILQSIREVYRSDLSTYTPVY